VTGELLHDQAERVADEHVAWWRAGGAGPASRSRFAPTLCAAEIGAHAATWDEARDALARAWLDTMRAA